MSTIDSAVADFVRGLGIAAGPGALGPTVSLDFERGGRLSLEALPDALLVYLVQPVAPHDREVAVRALALCHAREERPFDVHAGMRGDDRLVFLVRLAERDVTPVAIDQALTLLRHLHEMVRQ